MKKSSPRSVKTDNFVLDLTTPKWLKFFGEMRLLSAVFKNAWQNEDGTYNVKLTEKVPGTCFDKPNVDWKKVRPGDVLWHEDYPDGMLGGSSGWWPVRVTRKYDRVVFFRWLDGPRKGELDHVEQGSLSGDKMFYPYIIRLPEDIRITDNFNPKQIYEYVS